MGGGTLLVSGGASAERRDYIFDAWADVAVTLALATATVIARALEYEAKHLNVWVRISLLSLEIGSALAVVDHVSKMLWYRTLIGSLCRRFWSWLRRDGTNGKGNGPAGPGHSGVEDSGTVRREQTPPDSSLYYFVALYRSWTLPCIEPSHDSRFKLAHPKPGSRRLLAVSSIVLAMVASFLVFLVKAVAEIIKIISGVVVSSHGVGAPHATVAIAIIALLVLFSAFVVRTSMWGMMTSTFLLLVVGLLAVIFVLIAVLVSARK